MRLIAILSLLACLAVPALAQDPVTTIETANSASQDTAIENRLFNILGVLGNYDDVQVSVQEGVVTLSGTVTSAQEQAALDALAARVDGVVAVQNNVTETTDVGARLNPAFDRFRARTEQLIAVLPLVAIAFVVFGIIVWIGFRLSRLAQPWNRLAPNAFIAEILRQVFRIAFVVIGLVVALDIVNATALLSTILGAAGIIGLALGFAVKDTVENFIASVMLSVRQPFFPNDLIEINGDIGKVIRLTSRATILLSNDGNHIRIPNSVVFKSRLINYTQNAERRFIFPISVARDTDLATARNLIETTVQALPFVLKVPAAQVWIDTLEAGGVVLQVSGWIDQRDSSPPLAQGEAIRLVKRALEAADIEIPDNVQAIAIQRGVTTAQDDARQTPSRDSGDVAPVSATQEGALDDLIAAERTKDTAKDLLGENGMQE